MATMMRVNGAWIGLLRDWLDQCGCAAPELRARISSWAPDDIVPLAAWCQMLNAGMSLAPNEPAPELAIGARVQPCHVGVLGYLVLAAETLGEAMIAYQRYEKLFYGVGMAEVVGVGDQVELRWAKETAELGQDGDGVAIAALITFLRNQVPDPPSPTLVSFVHSLTVERRAAYEAFFGCPVQDNDSHVRVRFPLSYLAIRMPHADPALKSLLDRQADALLQAIPDSDDFDRALQRVLLRLLAEGEPTLERAAAVLHLSPRTLQRRLAKQGFSWQQWLDRNREQLARQYLGDRSLGLSDIALLLGFSEQSAFNRAFRRWTGTSPGKYRTQWAGG
ncbi:MAG: helix-turn-helix domain-containing protein [Alcanivoracaceae bacterium]